MRRLTEILHQAIASRDTFALCTVVETSGSTPLKAGAKMIVWDGGKSEGTVGGGNVEKQVIDDAVEILKTSDPELRTYQLLRQQMCCGGTMKIFIEPYYPQKQLFIFGAGHIGQHIAGYARQLDFSVSVIDEREEMTGRIGDQVLKINLNHRDAFPGLKFDNRTYILICTHLHAYDREILAYCIHQPHAYLGMIGSRRKVLVTRKRFLEQNLCSAQQLDEVDMPMGFDIGQNSPGEIALGILAKVVAVSNHKSMSGLRQHPEAEITIQAECLSDT